MADMRNRTPFYGAVPTSKIRADHVIGMEDYIVEEGTVGAATYRKWNSGIAECWALETDLNISGPQTWGSIYFYNITTDISFPITFIDPPSVVFGPVSGTSGSLINAQINVGSIANLQFMRGTTTSGTARVTYYAVGKWK